jgi:hypothetical protein
VHDVLVEWHAWQTVTKPLGVGLTTSALFRNRRALADVEAALGMLSIFTGEQAGALLLIVQLLVREHLVSIAEARRLMSVLSCEPEVQRRVTAQLARRKARPLRQTAVRKPS